MVNPHWNPKSVKGRANLRAFRFLKKDSDAYPDDFKLIIPCGVCLGCLRDYARAWRVRLLHEHKYGKHDLGYCLTLTIAPEHYEKFQSKEGMRKMLRSFFDRLRFYTPGRRIPKHFFVSELGEERGRLHFHGFIWDVVLPRDKITRAWSYGFIWVDFLKSDKQLSYCTKYITKPAVAWHKPTVFVSPKLGVGYLSDACWMGWHHAGNADTNINLCCKFGNFVYALPSYYRKKIFTDDELSRFKAMLSESDRPFEKVLGRSTYSDPLTYARDREKMLLDSVRSGRSKVVKPRSVPSVNSAFDDDSVAYEFNNDLTPF